MVTGKIEEYLREMTFSKKIFKIACLILLCIAQTGCALIQVPIDLLGTVVSSAVQIGIAAAPYAAPYFL